MPQLHKRRQQSLQRKAAKRKEKQRAAGREVIATAPRALLRSAGGWPLEECLISKNWDNWDKGSGLVQILVARRSPAGYLAAGVFLVDLGCLGVKSAFARLFESKAEYEHTLRPRISELQPMVKADLNLAAKIIREGIAYARGFGFRPDPDVGEAAILLEGADPDASKVRVPLGRDGKPFYVAGPRDNVQQIMAKLEKAVGRGGFHFMVPVDPSSILLDEED